jgi:membrane-bound lytic murein transglycosylase A
MMLTGGEGERTATSAARAIALAGALTVALAVAGLSDVVTQSLAEPIITTQSITPPGTPAPQATTKSPVKPPAKSLAKPPMAKPTSPPPTPSKPVTPQLAAPKPAAPQPVTLQAAAFADLPGWQADDHLAALKTFVKSCDKVIKGIPGAPDDAASVALADACRAAIAIKSPTKASAKAFFESRFVPNRVIHKESCGLLTGYYEPVLEGSRTRAGPYQTPIYRRPPDLLNVVAETQRAVKSDSLTHVRKTDTGTQPYFTRAEIEQGALANKGLELLYLADPVDVFFMHIQGSARIHLTDGTTTRINYDGKNGHPYTSIGRYLVEKGLLDANKVSMQKLCKWLRDDPERGKQVMWQNASFIFFRELKDVEADAGPMGALSVSLTAGRSLAVDPTYAPLGSPVYVSAPTLPPISGKKGDGFNRLMVAQDVGSAIKGPERGDIYFGSGEKAGKIAGVTKHPGNFFVLVPVSVQDHPALPWQTTDQAGP